MLRDSVSELGTSIFRPSLRPYSGRILKRALIYGLDTEWYRDSRGRNRFLCWQLSLDEGHTQIYREPLTWDSLYRRSCEMARSAGYRMRDISTMVYGVFFATAEAQWLLTADVRGDPRMTIETFGSHQLNIRYRPVVRRSMYMFDVSLWGNGSGLADVARTFGLTKRKYDTAHLTRESLDDPEFIQYALNDAFIVGEILRRLRDRIISDCQVDILSTRTPASTAAADFRRRYIQREIIGYRTVKKFSKRTRRVVERRVPVYASIAQTCCRARRYAMMALHGGRRECFYRGELPMVYEYDAKSAYPTSCVRLGILPLRRDLHIISGRDQDRDLDVWLSAAGGWGKVYFRFPNDTPYPCLPVDTAQGIVYPLEGTSWCTNFEVRVAVGMGATIRLDEGYYYNSGIPWMSEYEGRLMELRRSTDDPIMSSIYKLLGNSLVGKLCQHRLGYDIGDMLRASRESGIPMEIIHEVINLPDELGIRKTYHMGSVFMPEWYTLIVGWYRANVAAVVSMTRAVQVATDAVFTESYLGERFEHDGVVYELVSSGPYVGYRSGLYRVGDHVRHHGCSREIGETILSRFMDGVPWVEYSRRRITTLKESLRRSDRRFGEEWGMPCRVYLYFDGKRLLDSETGWSVPLATADQFIELRRDKDRLRA